MKLLLCSDIHDNEKYIQSLKETTKKEKVEGVICAGDFTMWGRNLEKILEKLNSFNVPIFLIEGNHEEGENIPYLIEDKKNIFFVESNPVFHKGFIIVGFGGGGFSSRAIDFDIRLKFFISELFELISYLYDHGILDLAIPKKDFEKIKKSKSQKQKINFIKKQFKGRLIFVTHQPPYNFKIDYIHGNHVGNNDFRELVEIFEPLLFVSGHIHETAGVVDKHKNTLLINPGWKGKLFKTE